MNWLSDTTALQTRQLVRDIYQQYRLWQTGDHDQLLYKQADLWGRKPSTESPKDKPRRNKKRSGPPPWPWWSIGLGGSLLGGGLGTYNLGRALGQIGDLTVEDVDRFLREYPRPTMAPEIPWGKVLRDILLWGKMPSPSLIFVGDEEWKRKVEAILEGRRRVNPAKEHLLPPQHQGLLRDAVPAVPSFFKTIGAATMAQDFLENYLHYTVLGHHLLSAPSRSGMTPLDWVKWFRQPHSMWLMEVFMGPRTRYWGENAGYLVNGKMHRPISAYENRGGDIRDHYTAFAESPVRGHEQLSHEMPNALFRFTLPSVKSIVEDYQKQLRTLAATDPDEYPRTLEERKQQFIRFFRDRMTQLLIKENPFISSMTEKAELLPPSLQSLPYIARDVLVETPALRMTQRTAGKLYDTLQDYFARAYPDLPDGQWEQLPLTDHDFLKALGLKHVPAPGQPASSLTPEQELDSYKDIVNRIRAVMVQYEDLLKRDPFQGIKRVHQELSQEVLPELHGLTLALEKGIQPSYSLSQYRLMATIPELSTRAAAGAYHVGNILRYLGLMSVLGGGAWLGWSIYDHWRQQQRYLRRQQRLNRQSLEQSAGRSIPRKHPQENEASSVGQ